MSGRRMLFWIVALFLAVAWFLQHQPLPDWLPRM